ncbi:guanine-1-methyltransferase-domain-containing protein [Abortiporus biennis]|nr:guanine-1-methyltransferase-domain-containing protein [Abortiporus biennis]
MEEEVKEVSQVASTSGIPDTEPTQPLSKNAQKKLAKAARLTELKKERRAYEKVKRKEKKKRLREEREQEKADGVEGEQGDEGRVKKRAKTETEPKKPFDARVVIDLGFDDKMSENEIRSLTSQLAFTYSANRKAATPFTSVLFTSLNGRTFTRLESISDAAYKRWIDTEWWEEGYEELWKGNESGELNDEENTDGPETKKRATAPKDSVIYLTADSTDELTELKEGEIYIIGGICDHNRYKNLCFNKANEHGIRSARLPIGTYLAELKTRKVLTVNQTFEILLKWAETKSWEEALYSVVPKRKFKDNKPEEESKEVVVSLKDINEDPETVGELDVLEGGEGVVVAAPGDPTSSFDNGPAIVMDPDDNAEVPTGDVDSLGL